jgi:hypothetical protein
VTELDHFLNEPECQSIPEFGDLAVRVRHMANVIGFRRSLFKVDRYPTPLGYVRSDSTKLRLYCCYYGDFIVIGSGGVKHTRKLQDTESTKDAYERMLYVSSRIEEKRKDGDLKITSSGFRGELKFDRKE